MAVPPPINAAARPQRSSWDIACWALKLSPRPMVQPLTEAVEARLVAAFETHDRVDARLVLLTMHAGLIHPTVVERYQLTAE